MLCGLVLVTACTNSVTGPQSTHGPGLTAAAALGELRTVDFCSLLDASGAAGSGTVTKPSLFMLGACRAEVTDGASRFSVVAGPLSAGSDSGLSPYDYHGAALPLGISVQRSTVDAKQGCTRELAFNDGIRLALAASDLSGGVSSSPDARCAKADRLVAGALAAITGQRVGHIAFDERSFGRLDACALLTDPDVDRVLGSGVNRNPDIGGHGCMTGSVSLTFMIGVSPAQPSTDVLGGVPAAVDKVGAFCQIVGSLPAPGSTAQAQTATVSVVNLSGVATDSDCATARAVAGPVFAKLPKP